MNKDVVTALKQLVTALEAAADAEGNSVAELNAYFIMEQEVQNAASRCAQSLHWVGKKNDKSHD